jgi:hypothetical protein
VIGCGGLSQQKRDLGFNVFNVKQPMYLVGPKYSLQATTIDKLQESLLEMTHIQFGIHWRVIPLHPKGKTLMADQKPLHVWSFQDPQANDLWEKKCKACGDG